MDSNENLPSGFAELCGHVRNPVFREHARGLYRY
jgi:hypothetical protein